MMDDMLYEDIDTDHMECFIDPDTFREGLKYYHVYNKWIYATNGKRVVRCKTALPDGIYKPNTVEALHSSGSIKGCSGEEMAGWFEDYGSVGAKTGTVNLHEIPLKPTDAWNMVILNLVDNMWFSFDELSQCLTCSGREFIFEYTEQGKPIYIKEEVYEFLCMPYDHEPKN